MDARIKSPGMTWSELSELAVGDHGAGGLAGRRAAKRLERNREHGLVVDLGQKIFRHLDRDRTARIDEPERMRLIPGRDQPKLQGFLLLAEERRGHDGEARFARVDGGDKARLSAIGVKAS